MGLELADVPDYPPTTSFKSRIYNPTKNVPKKEKHVRPRLELFKELPNEINFEIFSYLCPLDLLHLAYSCKSFAALLRPESRVAWVRARQNVPDDLPAPHPSLSEPKYAAALFIRTCMACGVGRSDELDYVSMRRFCKACLQENVWTATNLLRRKAYAEVRKDDAFWHTVTPWNPWWSRSDEPLDQPATGRDAQYYVPEFRAVYERYLQAREMGGEVLETFIAARRQLVATKLEHGTQTLEWRLRFDARRKKEADAMKEDFSNAVTTRLQDLGYQETDFPSSYNHEWSLLVSQPRQLTDRVWTKLLPKLEAVIHEYQRACRLRQRGEELLALYDVFLPNVYPLDMKMHLPRRESVQNHPQIEPVLQEADGTIPMTAARFQEHVFPVLRQHAMSSLGRILGGYMDAVYGPSRSREIESKFMLSWESLKHCTTWMLRFPTQPARMLHYTASTPLALSLRDYAWSEVVPDADWAAKVLRAVGLRLDIPYASVPPGIVCTCGDPSFVQPAPFSELVTHIWQENAWFEAYLKCCMNDPQKLQGVRNDHSFSPYTGFLRLLPPGFEGRYLAPTIQPANPLPMALADVELECRLCAEVVQPNGYTLWRAKREVCRTMKGYALPWHVRSKHGRDAGVEDALLLE